MQARHDEIVATVARTNESQAQQIQALHAELIDLQQQLRSQDAEMARLREQFEEMSRRAGRARAEADRAQAEAASARPDLNQGGIDRTFSQVTSLAAPGQLTTSTPDTADGVRQDHDPDKALTAPTDVRITPETSADREEWTRQRESCRESHARDRKDSEELALGGGGCVAVVGSTFLGTKVHWAVGVAFLLVTVLLISYRFFRRWFFRPGREFPDDLRVHPIDGRWQVVSGPQPDRSDHVFEWNNPDRAIPIELAFKAPPRYDERPVFVRETLYLESPTELMHSRYVSVQWMLREGSRLVASGSLRVPSCGFYASSRGDRVNLETVELPPSESPGPYTFQLERTDDDCAEVSVIWRNHGVLARRWYRWHRLAVPDRPEEATYGVHNHQQQNPATGAAERRSGLGVQRGSDV